MADTLKLVRKAYGHQANTNRAVEIAIREADLSDNRTGLWSAIYSLFG